MIKEAIKKITEGTNLTKEEALEVMNEIMSGNTTQSQTAAFLTALHIKGETVDEIAACAYGMRSHATALNKDGMDVLEIVGTGGDASNSFNISTTAAFVVSSTGVRVAKHGNRAASSKCGTADCLEALGVNLLVEPDRNAEILKNNNMCFMFAQKYHSAMKYVGLVRKEIGLPTVFNILGPLTNPAHNDYQLLGVYDFLEEVYLSDESKLNYQGYGNIQDAVITGGEDPDDYVSGLTELINQYHDDMVKLCQ